MSIDARNVRILAVNKHARVADDTDHRTEDVASLIGGDFPVWSLGFPRDRFSVRNR